LRSPSRTLQLHPGGTARISELTRTTVTKGGQTKQLTAYAIDGAGYSPLVVWMEADRYFGTAGRLSTLPIGWQPVAETLYTAQASALARRGEALVPRLAPVVRGAVAFRNVQLFDSRAGTFGPGMTIVAQAGRITAVGPAAATSIPRGARVIEGRGRTLLPALWDSHSHFGSDEMGVRLLSQGIAFIRDPGNDIETSVPRRARIEAGTLLGPHIVASLMIDGPGPLATPGTIVSNRTEALAAVNRARELGFSGVKLYGSVDPALVEPIAAEAHRLGLRVHGHIQRGFRPANAVAAGYDEITHINWVMMQGMPQEVIDRSNGLDRFYGPYRYGPALDLRAEPMNSFLGDLARRRIVVDPTLVVFEGDFIRRDELPRSLRPFAGTLPPLVERYSLGPDIAPTAEVPVEQIERGFRSWQALVRELHARGVPIVAGTDGDGLGLVRELELYVEAGLTPAQAIQTATLVPATQFGLGNRTGAIEVGRQADLVLVEGDPSRNVGDLRAVEYVMTRGRLMKASDLRSAAGLGQLRR
jgi:imidazolonepropionase-like amidohydrolase